MLRRLGRALATILLTALTGEVSATARKFAVFVLVGMLPVVTAGCRGPSVEEVRYAFEHYSDVDFVELPDVEPMAPTERGMPVEIDAGLDARTDPKLSAIWQVGPSIVEQADELMANELAKRGFRPIRFPAASDRPKAQRTVVIKVLSAQHLRSSVVTGPLARVELEILVLNPERRQVFSRAYTGEAAGGGISRLMFGAGSQSPAAFVGRAVSDAMADALAKACGDSAFVAALGVNASG